MIKRLSAMTVIAVMVLFLYTDMVKGENQKRETWQMKKLIHRVSMRFSLSQ